MEEMKRLTVRRKLRQAISCGRKVVSVFLLFCDSSPLYSCAWPFGLFEHVGVKGAFFGQVTVVSGFQLLQITQYVKR